MCIPKHNHEGYADPTAYAALSNAVRQNRFIYICSPYRDNPRVNVMRARNYCKFAVSKGKIPPRSASVFSAVYVGRNRAGYGYADELRAFEAVR